MSPRNQATPEYPDGTNGIREAVARLEMSQILLEDILDEGDFYISIPADRLIKAALLIYVDNAETAEDLADWLNESLPSIHPQYTTRAASSAYDFDVGGYHEMVAIPVISPFFHSKENVKNLVALIDEFYNPQPQAWWQKLRNKDVALEEFDPLYDDQGLEDEEEKPPYLLLGITAALCISVLAYAGLVYWGIMPSPQKLMKGFNKNAMESAAVVTALADHGESDLGVPAVTVPLTRKNLTF
ncbi:MAG: hypothetical protein ACOYK8_10165 [Alphaproteobacteria bacterium]